MSNQQTGPSREEMHELADRLTQFRGSLNPRQQSVLDYVVGEARAAIGEVRGYDDGPHVPERLVGDDYSWVASIQFPPTLPPVRDRLAHFSRPDSP